MFMKWVGGDCSVSMESPVSPWAEHQVQPPPHPRHILVLICRSSSLQVTAWIWTDLPRSPPLSLGLRCYPSKVDWVAPRPPLPRGPRSPDLRSIDRHAE